MRSPALRRLVLWAPVFLLLAIESWISSRPHVPMPRIPFADKVIHAGYFFGVGIWAVRAARPEGWPARRLVLTLLVGAALYAAADEWHQAYVPGRDSSVADAMADTAGVALAVAAFARRRVPILEA